MFIYQEEHKLTQPLTSSGLLRLMQNAAGEHCERTGPNGALIRSKNLMWVIIRQAVEMERFPEAGEDFLLRTWPGPVRHMFFPRYTAFVTQSGETLGRGSALWALVDRDSRKMVSPGAYGIELEGLATGEECRLPSAPAKLPLAFQGEYTVPSEVLDVNGHMNNTRYYDLAESLFGGVPEGKRLRRAMTEYVSEAREGDRIRLSWGREGDRFYVAGAGEGEKTIFKMGLEYA